MDGRRVGRAAGRTGARSHQPRSIHSSRWGRSVPIVVSRPWPGSTSVSSGSVENSRWSIDSMICRSSRPSNVVLPGPPGKRVSPLNSTGWPSSGSTSSRACGRACGSCGGAGRRPRSRRRRRGRSRRTGASRRPRWRSPTSMPASRTAVDGLDVVEVAVGGEHPADAGGLADLEQQLVLVGRVDEDRVAASACQRTTKTLFSYGPTTSLSIRTSVVS